MRIIFSSHAKLKIDQRKIPRSYIVDAVTHPDIETSSYNFRIELYKKFRKRSLKVVAKKEKKSVVIITAHWVEVVKHL